MSIENYHAVDRVQLAKDLDAIQRELLSETTQADFEHLKKIEWWGRICSILGYSTAWIMPNPISAYFISQGNFTRWTTIAHHVLHRGYDKVPGIPKRYTSKVFARGWRRYLDWLDWMHPDAWDTEHNDIHHYRLGEKADPDQVEHNMEELRNSPIPRLGRYILLGLMAASWKIIYYSSSTLNEHRAMQAKKAGLEPVLISRADVWNPLTKTGRDLWLSCMLPYSIVRFGVIPLLFTPLGPVAVTNVLLTSLMAEVITNLHTFLVIGPNHAGEDVFMFDNKSTNKGEFYLRQIVGSANFNTKPDLTDFLHGWLNYQIEHHLWPDMALSQYQKVQPRVKAVCEKHNIPYLQESVFIRLWKTLNVMVGKSSMIKPEQTLQTS
ncbi:MAG: fatty acid desaturase [Methylococcaceae bacterium]|nr:fatty acid desaturase [Methylococcaceae bacterium]